MSVTHCRVGRLLSLSVSRLLVSFASTTLQRMHVFNGEGIRRDSFTRTDESALPILPLPARDVHCDASSSHRQLSSVLASPSPPSSSGRTSTFNIPDEVFAKGHMHSVHPSLLAVIITDAQGQLQLHAAPIKVVTLNGFDAQSKEPSNEGLLLELIARPTHPDDYSAIIPLIADTGGRPRNFSFNPVAGERYQRTEALVESEVRNHVGLLQPRWAGDVEKRTNEFDGDLRRLLRIHRGPLPQLVSLGETVTLFEHMLELRVVVCPVNRPLQLIATPAEATDSAIFSTSFDPYNFNKKRKISSESAGRKQGRFYGILQPCTEYSVRVLGVQCGFGVEQVAILWAAPGSRDEQVRRQKRVKKYILFSNRGEDVQPSHHDRDADDDNKRDLEEKMAPWYPRLERDALAGWSLAFPDEAVALADAATSTAHAGATQPLGNDVVFRHLRTVYKKLNSLTEDVKRLQKLEDEVKKLTELQQQALTKSERDRLEGKKHQLPSLLSPERPFDISASILPHTGVTHEPLSTQATVATVVGECGKIFSPAPSPLTDGTL